MPPRGASAFVSSRRAGSTSMSLLAQIPRYNACLSSSSAAAVAAAAASSSGRTRVDRRRGSTASQLASMRVKRSSASRARNSTSPRNAARRVSMSGRRRFRASRTSGRDVRQALDERTVARDGCLVLARQAQLQSHHRGPPTLVRVRGVTRHRRGGHLALFRGTSETRYATVCRFRAAPGPRATARETRLGVHIPRRPIVSCRGSRRVLLCGGPPMESGNSPTSWFRAFPSEPRPFR